MLQVTDSDRLSKDPVANSDIRSTADDNSLSGESLDSLTQGKNFSIIILPAVFVSKS